ncbi:MAG: nicotinate-nucleotide adenylyltransferase [Nitrosomonas sp.]|nr:nicotinate-nucleotide adenylyltransferase [Nitrosomonas sp.]
MASRTLIGIYGGTFDPIHYGHLRVAEELADNIGFDRFYFVPAGEPRLREVPAASKDQRCEMVRLAIADNPVFRLDEREIKRQGVSTTVESLQEYHAEFKGRATLCFVMGADTFVKLHHWRHWHKLFELCHLIIVDRPGSLVMKDQQRLPEEIRQACVSRWVARSSDLTRCSSGMIYVAQTTLLDISATNIRALVAAGRSIRYLLHESVADFIKTHHLYTGANGFKNTGKNYS